MSVVAKLEELGLELPPPPPPGGTYSPVVVVEGRTAYVSGHGPMLPDETYLQGKVGGDLTLEEGQAAAKQVGLSMLATLQEQLGDLDRIERWVKTLGMVNATPDFTKHPLVINGFSDLMVELYGDAGRAARSAVGMGSLPGNIAVEIESILLLKP